MKINFIRKVKNMIAPKGYRIIKIKQSPAMTSFLTTVFYLCGFATLGIIAYLFIILN
jgi:hypothetical protein